MRLARLAPITAHNLKILKPLILEFAAILRMGWCLEVCSRTEIRASVVEVAVFTGCGREENVLPQVGPQHGEASHRLVALLLV